MDVQRSPAGFTPTADISFKRGSKTAALPVHEFAQGFVECGQRVPAREHSWN